MRRRGRIGARVLDEPRGLSKSVTNSTVTITSGGKPLMTQQSQSLDQDGRMGKKEDMTIVVVVVIMITI